MVRTALIGLSGFGAVHFADLTRLHRAGRLAFTAAAVVNQAEEAEKCEELRSLGCRIFPDAATMFREQAGAMDLCCIPTGIALHKPMALAALRAGCRVMIEKPAAPRLCDVRELQRAERAAGRFVAVAFPWYYQPGVRKVRRLLERGALGRVRRALALSMRPHPDAYFHRNRWAGKLRDGRSWVLDSQINNADAHSLHLLTLWCGPVAAVRAGLFRARRDTVAPECCLLQLRFAGGGDGFCYCADCAEQVFRPEIRIECEHGSIVWDPQEIVIETPAGTERLPHLAPTEWRDALVLAHVRRCAGEPADLCTLEHAARHTAAVGMAHNSCPVRAFAADRTVVMPSAGGPRTVVPGLDNRLLALYRGGGGLPAADGFFPAFGRESTAGQVTAATVLVEPAAR